MKLPAHKLTSTYTRYHLLLALPKLNRALQNRFESSPLRLTAELHNQIYAHAFVRGTFQIRAPPVHLRTINDSLGLHQACVQLRYETKQLLDTFTHLRIFDYTAAIASARRRVPGRYPQVLMLKLDDDFTSVLLAVFNEFVCHRNSNVGLAAMVPSIEIVMLRAELKVEEKQTCYSKSNECWAIDQS